MKTFISSFTFVVLVFISEIASAQITFQRTYSNTTWSSVQQTSDGGYIILGNTNNVGNSLNIYLIRTDSIGDTLWTRYYGGSGYDEAFFVEQTTDGGYIITGKTWSFGAGQYDAYLIKTDANGNLVWSKTFGQLTTEEAISVCQTSDGGYVITGRTLFVNAGFLIKTDANGDSLWIKYYQIGSFHPTAVLQTTDGGFIISGFNETNGSTNKANAYLIKTDSNGDTLWTKSYGGTEEDYGLFVQQTTDGGFIMTGYTGSFGAGSSDVYLVKTDANGDTLWTKAYGGTYFELAYSVRQTNDGGFIMSGEMETAGTGIDDAYLIKADSTGNLLWSRLFGGVYNDFAYSVQLTIDGGYIIAGRTSSFNGGFPDAWLIKTDSNGNSGCNEVTPPTIVSATSTQVINRSPTVFSLNNIVTTPATITGSGGTVTTLCTTVDIQSTQNPKHEISISPNPFHTSTTILLNENFSPALTFEIFNVEGKMIRQVRIISHETIIERDGLAAGVYFYQLTGGGNVKSVGKLLVQ